MEINKQELYDMAHQARESAYAPYSKFRVGAALLTASGKIYTGCNIENASLGATICAERTAAVKAVSEGEREFVAIAVATDEGEAVPCGICRQFLSEFGSNMTVITCDQSAEGAACKLNTSGLQELLPYQFNLDCNEQLEK